MRRGINFFNELKKYTISIDILRVIAVAVVPPFAVIYVAVVFGLAFRFHIVAVAALPTIAAAGSPMAMDGVTDSVAGWRGSPGCSPSASTPG